MYYIMVLLPKFLLHMTHEIQHNALSESNQSYQILHKATQNRRSWMVFAAYFQTRNLKRGSTAQFFPAFLKETLKS